MYSLPFSDSSLQADAEHFVGEMEAEVLHRVIGA